MEDFSDMEMDKIAEDKVDKNVEDVKINVSISHGQGQLWNAGDVNQAWTLCRIVGVLVGGLPRCPHQAGMMGLPLTLMPEEVTLLKEKGFAQLVTYPEMTNKPSDAVKDTFSENRKKCYEEQVVMAIQQRKQEIERVAGKILEGKRKKFKQKGWLSNPNAKQIEKFVLTRERVIAEEMKKINKLPEHLQVVEIFTENPMIEMLDPVAAEWSFPSSNMEKLRYATYKDMWEREYYISTGIKFGGDFLVYPGDPHLFHATFIVKCVEDMDSVDVHDLVCWSRIGTATKKTLVLAFFGQTGQVSYKSYQWHDNVDTGS